MVKKIVFLDRDGVINKLVERDGRQVSPRRFDDFEILPGVHIAIRKLREFGFEIVVVTNQPDISRGLMQIHELDLMHELVQSLGVHEIRFCPHSGEEDCECRKPKTGMLVNQLKAYLGAKVEVWMIGDSESDVVCGNRVGARTILISNDTEIDSAAEHIDKDLEQAANYIVSMQVSFGTVVR
jgi:D-glycero-D-manno-heptose 1,7-bisphosphate phosphatase